ncbi:MAG TPA: RNA polymerase sigma factor [Thermoanaerobaculia bacterium]
MSDRDERFEAAYRRYYARVYKYFRGCRVADDEAHDLSQDTFRRFYEKLHTLRNENEVPFLFAIARSVFLNWYRGNKTAKRGAKTVDIEAPAIAPELPSLAAPDYAQRQQLELRKKRLHDAIAQLPEGQRQCIELRLEDASYEEIAAKLGISVEAVKSRIRDAKRLLRARLGDDTFPEDEQ